jgi:hypothetical protein
MVPNFLEDEMEDLKSMNEIYEMDEGVCDAIEPYLSSEYAKSIGREDWAKDGTRCVRVGPAHELYQAVKALVDKRVEEAKK